MTYQSFSFGLLGQNIGYSKSPDVFDAIFEVDNVEGDFELFDIRSPDLKRELPKVLQKHLGGLSVTIPYKQRVIPFLDTIDEAASTLHAVNSISIGEKLTGHNTDWLGFVQPVQALAEPFSPGFALILGCGGAARAAIYGLWRVFGFQQFRMVSRRSESLEEAREALEPVLTDAAIDTVLSDRLPPLGRSYRIVVNATPLGGWNHPEKSPLPAGFDWSQVKLYYDLNYNRDNSLVRSARDSGVVSLDGSGMLVAQALESYRLWTGRSVEFEPVYKRAFKID